MANYLNPNIQEKYDHIRNIAKEFGLCIYGLETPQGVVSKYFVMHQPPTSHDWIKLTGTDGNTYDEKRSIYDIDKTLRGGVLWKPMDEYVYVFGEYILNNPISSMVDNIPPLKELILNVPDLDDSFLGDVIEFVKVPLNELPDYLKQVYDEHKNNGRKSAVQFSKFIKRQQPN